MSLSCLYYRWFAGRDADTVARGGHADNCPRCAAYTQRLRSLDARFCSVRGGGAEIPDGLHAKITAAVREAKLESATRENANPRWMFTAFCGVAAVLVFIVVAENRIGDVFEYGPDIAVAPAVPLVPVPSVASPSLTGSPAESIARSAVVPQEIGDVVPSAGRHVAKFTGELPALLVSKVSAPYESEMGLLADDLSAAGSFLSSCLFVPEVLQSSGL